MLTKDSKNLEGKVAIITGGSKGLGFAIAEALAKEGTLVYLIARKLDSSNGKQGLREAKEKIERRGGFAEIFQGDITDFDKMKGIINSVYEQKGRLDIFVNNAGEYKPASSVNDSIKMLEDGMALLFWPAMRITKYLIDKFKDNPNNEISILNIISQASLATYPGGFFYQIPKTALLAGSRSIEKDLEEEGIKHINLYGLHPATVRTPGTEKYIEEGKLQNPLESAKPIVDSALALLTKKTSSNHLYVGKENNSDRIEVIALDLKNHDLRHSAQMEKILYGS